MLQLLSLAMGALAALAAMEVQVALQITMGALATHQEVMEASANRPGEVMETPASHPEVMVHHLVGAPPAML